MAGAASDLAMRMATWGQGSPAPEGFSKEMPRSGCSSCGFQYCRVLSWLIKGCWG